MAVDLGNMGKYMLKDIREHKWKIRWYELLHRIVLRSKKLLKIHEIEKVSNFFLKKKNLFLLCLTFQSLRENILFYQLRIWGSNLERVFFFNLNVFILNHRIIAFHYCIDFWPISKSISHRYIYVPSLFKLPPTSHLPSHPTLDFLLIFFCAVVKIFFPLKRKSNH